MKEERATHTTVKQADSLPSVSQHRGDVFTQSEPEDPHLLASPWATLATLRELRDETLVDTARAIALKNAEISASVVRKWLEEEQLCPL